MRVEASIGKRRLALAGPSLLLCALVALLTRTDVAEAQSVPTCEPQVHKAAFPSQLLLGEPVQIRMTVHEDPKCERQVILEQPLDVTVAIDVSRSMGATAIRNARETAKQFIEEMDLDGHALTRISIMAVSDQASLRCEMDNNPGELSNCLQQQIGSSGVGSYYPDLQRAASMAKRHVDDSAKKRGDAKKGIVIISDGRDPRCTQGNVNMRGIEVATVCASDDCDRSCMSTLAEKSGGSFVPIDQRNNLTQGFAQLRSERFDIETVGVRITDTLPAGYKAVENSFDPAYFSRRVAGDQETLIWRFGSIPDTGLSVSFQALPTRLGMQPANHLAEVSLLDNLGRSTRSVFPNPFITVLGSITETPPPSTLVPPMPSPSHTPTTRPTRPIEPSAPPPVITRPPDRPVYRSWFPLVWADTWNED